LESGSNLGQVPRESLTPIIAPPVKSPFFRITTDEDKAIDAIWKDVIDPILQYADVSCLNVFFFLLPFPCSVHLSAFLQCAASHSGKTYRIPLNTC
jgi:hypothetical protein